MYLFSSFERHVLQFDGRQPLLFTERWHHLSSGCCHFLQDCHHPGQVFPAVWKGVWHLLGKKVKTNMKWKKDLKKNYFFYCDFHHRSGVLVVLGFFFLTWWFGHYGYLLSEAKCRWDAGRVSSRHSATDLLAELPDVTTGCLQILQQHGEIGFFLTRVQECPQTTHLHSHAVQGTLGKLHMNISHE